MNNSVPRKRLPVHPSLEHLQKQAKRLAKENPSLKLAQAQHQLAREYGCKSWAELTHVVETMRRGGDQLSNVRREIEPLPKAARMADRKTVESILQSGAFTQHDLDQGLAHSVWYEEHGTWDDRKALADLFIRHGADPDGQYGSNYGPIVFGTLECLNPEGLEYLIAAGADVKFSPVQTKYGPVCPLAQLLGTYSRGRNDRKHRMIDILLANQACMPSEVTPPILAIHRGDAAKLAELIDQDPGLVRQKFPAMPYGNIELKGATLLHCAVEFGELECLQLLFDKYHADINMKADIIDGIGGQTSIYHAINTNGDGNFPILEYLVKRVGPWIDMSVRATWRSSGDGVQSNPITPLEYAGLAAQKESKKWRKKIEEELSILRSLDHTGQLKAAILKKDDATVARLLDERPDLLTPVLWPEAIFQAKSISITKLLLDRGLNPDECTAPRKPLHLAVYQCLPDIVDLLIERGADVNLRNPLDETPLELLDAYEPRPIGDPDSHRIRESLIKAGAHDDFYSVIRAGDLAEVRERLKKDPALARSDSSLGGPLCTASRSGRAKIVSALLEAGADPNKVNSKGNTPLWFAAQSPAKPASSRIEVMKILLDAGADIHHRCENGTTALHFAAWRGPAEVVEFLLSKGARNWITDVRNKTPLDHAREMSVSLDKEVIIDLFSGPRIKDPVFKKAVNAISSGNLNELKDLLSQNPNLVRARAEEKGEYAGPYFSGPTLLHFVAENPTRVGKLPENICALTQAILDAGAEVDASTAGSSPHTTMALVATSEPARKQGLQLPLIDVLFKNGADPRHAFFGAVVHREKAALEHLLKLTNHEHTLLTAASMGEIKKVGHLLLKKTDPEQIAEAANASIIEGHQDCLERLLSAGLSIDTRIPHHPYSPTLLHQAGSFGQSNIAKLLLDRGADPCLRDTQFHGTPADWAHQGKHPGLETLLRNAEDQWKAKAGDLKEADEKILAAVLKNDVASLGKFLDQYPQKISLTGGQWNKPLLHCAAWEGHLSIVQELLKRGFDVNTRCESDHACAIHFAAERGHLEIVKILADAGADLDAGDNDHRQTVLGWATALGTCQEAVARFLLSRGAPMTIWAAISLNDSASVRKLFQHNPALLQARMSRNEHSRTLLHQAVSQNRPAMVELLLELGADPNAKDSMDRGPLGEVNSSTDPQILNLLKTSNKDISLYDALVLGKYGQAEKLLANDPHCIRQGGREARLFVYAAVRKNWPMAEWLLAHGADINAMAEVYECQATALHFVASDGEPGRVRWLLDHGADTTIKDGKYDADASNWAEFYGKHDVGKMIEEHRTQKA